MTWIYFIQCGGYGGPVKIGRAVDPSERLKRLQTAHHEELELIAIVRGAAADERLMHEIFASSRIRGEWFRPDPDVLEAALAFAVMHRDEYMAMVA